MRVTAMEPTGSGAGPSHDELDSRELEDMREGGQVAVRRHGPRWLGGPIDDIVRNAVFRLLRTRERRAGDPHFSSMYRETSVSGDVVDEIRRLCRGNESPANDPGSLECLRVKCVGPELEHPQIHVPGLRRVFTLS